VIRIGFHLEGRTDDSVLHVLVARLLEVQRERIEVQLNEVRTRGIGQLLSSLPQAIQKFWFIGARAVVVGMDNDGENIIGEQDPRHPRHWLHEAACERCRYCRCVHQTRRALGLLPSDRAEEIRQWPVVISVPVEALEAWLLEEAHLVGRRPHRPAEALPHSQLKWKLYGRPFPTREDIERIAIPIAQRADLDSLRQRSRSFALFADSVTGSRRRIVSA
jgi:hypothetical protein